ncbi:MAG: 7-cyano-7-deazaguanine synthase QueC [Candidatus Lokiarchaeota archaeon]|nr:7-cyano-7-deazaguanine synthase QueC [Candidatus Lokiarchaeota archaeon]
MGKRAEKAAGKPKALVLCSGGLDSTTVLYHAIREGYDVYAVSFNYKQRHAIELAFVRRTLEKLGLVDKWTVFDLDFTQIGASALTDASLPVPQGRSTAEMEGSIPISYVPLRNTIFLTYAAALAESKGIQDIFVGVNVLDYSGYPDCRPAYIESIEQTLNLGSRYVDDPTRKFKVHVPLINKTKAQIIEMGRALGVDYDLTWSCYNPRVAGGRVEACGTCDSCTLRAKGFAEARKR